MQATILYSDYGPLADASIEDLRQIQHDWRVDRNSSQAYSGYKHSSGPTVAPKPNLRKTSQNPPLRFDRLLGRCGNSRRPKAPDRGCDKVCRPCNSPPAWV